MVVGLQIRLVFACESVRMSEEGCEEEGCRRTLLAGGGERREG